MSGDAEREPYILFHTELALDVPIAVFMFGADQLGYRIGVR